MPFLPRTVVTPALTALVFLTGIPPARAQPGPIPPRLVTLDSPADLTGVLTAIEKQTGIRVEPGAAEPHAKLDIGTIRKQTFWETAERVAAATNTRVTLAKHGRQVVLGKSSGVPAVVSLDGPFRVAARNVTARIDLDTGKAAYDLQLEINWEPRFPVFRVGSQPKITVGKDDAGRPLTAAAASVMSQVSGYAHTSTIRIDGLSRRSNRIASLGGTFAVTASPRMLTFTYDDLTAPLPATRQMDGVTAKLTRFSKEDDRWEVEVELSYPPSQPEFESFESWASGNVLKLVAPGKGEVFTPDNFDLAESSQRVRATYRFRAGGGKGPNPADRKGWKLVYETPAPLVEFPVKFELKDITLP